MLDFKVKMWTHEDLDAAGCAIVGYHFFGRDNVDVEFHGYKEIDNAIKNFILNEDLTKYDLYFITDINVNDEVAALIQEKMFDQGIKIKLIDHHASEKERLSKYKWCNIDAYHSTSPLETFKSSATSLLYLELNENVFAYPFPVGEGGVYNNKNLEDFVEIVRLYDTWLFKKFNNSLPKKMNDLFWILGRERFIDRMIFAQYQTEFTPEEKLILELEQDKINKYIAEKDSQLAVIHNLFDKYEVGIVYAENYFSELGNELSILHPELDFIAMIDLGRQKISYRGIKENVDLGKDVAAKFGGGGHRMAAGSQFGQEQLALTAGAIFWASLLKGDNK